MSKWLKVDQMKKTDHWVIEHDLNKKCLWIKCYVLVDGDLVKIIPKQINQVSNNKIECFFNKDYAGQLWIQ